MSKKKLFETMNYDPIQAEHNRSLARQLSRVGIQESDPHTERTPIQNQTLRPIHREEDRTNLVEYPTPPKVNFEPLGKATPIQNMERKEKRRSFTCASREQDRDLDTFIKRLSDMADTSVPFQVLLRAACVCMMRAEEQIIQELRKSPPPRKPATFEHDQYAHFEEYWIDILASALRRVRPLQGNN